MNSIFITLTPINDKYRKEDTGPVTSLTNQDIERFSRHLLMEEIGMKGTDAIILKVFLILKWKSSVFFFFLKSLFYVYLSMFISTTLQFLYWLMFLSISHLYLSVKPTNKKKKGQLKLKQAKVLIIGAGGLGSPSALYLAAAGVGKALKWEYTTLLSI